MIKALIFTGLFLLSKFCYAQPVIEVVPNYQTIVLDVHERQHNFSLMSMISLNSWSLGNMTYSAIVYNKSIGQDRYFHEMNMIFNAVNLGIGIPGIISLRKKQPNDFKSVYKNQKRLETVYLVNAGLDFGYVATGLALRSTGSTKKGETKERLMGYGSSIMVQGGYLLVHDVIAYLFFRSNHKRLELVWDNISIQPTGTGIIMKIK